MTESQRIREPVFTGAVGSPTGDDLTPGKDGVDFTPTAPASIAVKFAPGETPIVTQVTVPPQNTNVIAITVEIISPDGTTVVKRITSTSGNTVTGFPVEPLPEGTTIKVTFETSDGQPPQNVTLSVIACFKPSTAATIVSTGAPTGAPTATTVSTGTGAETRTTLIISTTTTSESCSGPSCAT